MIARALGYRITVRSTARMLLLLQSMRVSDKRGDQEAWRENAQLKVLTTDYV